MNIGETLNYDDMISKFMNINITTIDITIGDADTIIDFGATYTIDNEIFSLNLKEIEQLEKLNKNWHKLKLDDFKKLLFLVRL